MNAGSYFGYIGKGQYLNGIVAGHTSKTKKIGFVAAKPIPQVLLNINSFPLGARSVDPTITTPGHLHRRLVAAGQGGRSHQRLVDQGIDVITCHVDSPKVVIETAERPRHLRLRLSRQPGPLAPEGYLTGAEWNWAKVYKMFVDDLHGGRAAAQLRARRPGTEDFVKMSPYGAGRRRRRAQAGRRRQGRDDEGRLRRLQGPAQGQQGHVVVPAGQAFVETAIRAREHGLPGRGRRRLDRPERAGGAVR